MLIMLVKCEILVSHISYTARLCFVPFKCDTNIGLHFITNVSSCTQSPKRHRYSAVALLRCSFMYERLPKLIIIVYAFTKLQHRTNEVILQEIAFEYFHQASVLAVHLRLHFHAGAILTLSGICSNTSCYQNKCIYTQNNASECMLL